MMEELNCPRCGRKIIRPDGSETSCPCAAQIPKTTLDDKIRRVYTGKIIDEMHAENKIVKEMDNG